MFGPYHNYNSFNDPASETVAGLEYHFYSLINQSLKKANEDAGLLVLRFVLRKLSESLSRKSTIVFIQQLRIIDWIFRDILTKYPAFKISYRDEITLVLKDIIKLTAKIELRLAKTDSDKIIINNFIQLAFSSYLELIYKTLLYNQAEDFHFLLGYFKEISEYEERKPYQQRVQIEDLISKNQLAAALVIEDDLKLNNYISFVYDQSLFAVQSWVWYLYSKNLLDEDTLDTYSNKILLNYNYAEDIFNDFAYIANKSHEGYLGLDDWDFEEKTDGPVREFPQVQDWLMQGLVIYLFRLAQNSIPRLEFIYNDKQFYWISEKVTGVLHYLETNLPKWKRVILCSDENEFKKRKRVIEIAFKQLKRKFVSLEEQETAEGEISLDLVRKFQDLIYNAWSRTSRVKKLFDHFGNIQRNTLVENAYKKYYFSTFFIKAKSMFTDKDNQYIYGIEDMGARFGRGIDDKFFEVIMPLHTIKKYLSISLALEDYIKKLRDMGKPPNLIIMPPEFIVSESLTQNTKFVSKWSSNTESVPDSIGTFDGIPITGTYGLSMKNKLIVCNFTEAFEWEHFNSVEYVKNELDVQVITITPEMAQARFAKNPAKWLTDSEGNEISEKEALNLLMASVDIRIGIKSKFTSKDPSAYLVAEIDNGTISRLGL